MIYEIYVPYFWLIIFGALVIGAFGGYLLCGAFKQGERVDLNSYEVMLKEKINENAKLRTDLNVEILNNKRLEESLELMIQENTDRVHNTFTEIQKDHNKILVDPESNKKKIPERKIFKRRKLGAK